MPHSPTHPRSSSAAASVAYGMGSTHPYDNPSSSPLSSSSSSPSSKPAKKNKAGLKPSAIYNSYSDFADLPGPTPPPPNRGANLDISRFASFERKAEALAYTEQLLLDWLRDQARYTLPPDVNLAELNLASRILYRLTAIQKTMLSIDAVLKAQCDNQPVPPLDDDPLPPPDEGDDDPEPPLGARASTPATPLPVTSHETPSVNPLGPRTASSANTLPRANPINDLSSPANENRATISPASSESNINNALDRGHLTLDNPQSTIRNPQSIHAASVHACPTLPLARLERAHELNQADLSRITGQPLPQTAAPTDPAESSALTSTVASDAYSSAASAPTQSLPPFSSASLAITSIPGAIEKPPP